MRLLVSLFFRQTNRLSGGHAFSQLGPLGLRKKSSSLGPPRESSFSANCSSRLRKGSFSPSVCVDPAVLVAAGVCCCGGCCSFCGDGMLNIGSYLPLGSCEANSACSELSEKLGENGGPLGEKFVSIAEFGVGSDVLCC